MSVFVASYNLEQMFLLNRGSERQIREFREQQSGADFSYAAVGASREQTVPNGYVLDHNRVRLGSGDQTWKQAKLAISRWKMFDVPFLQLFWPDAQLAAGTTVAVSVQHFGFYSLNACRIVYVIDEGERFGFAYGTLAEHAESGEERFMVERSGSDGSVWYDLFAFSRPHATLAKVMRPLARGLQRRFAQESMAGMIRAVELLKTTDGSETPSNSVRG